MLEPMTKIHVIGHRSDLDATLETLQELAAVHLIDVNADSAVRLPPLAADEAHLRQLEELRYLRARLDGILGLARDPPAPDTFTVDDPAPVDWEALRTSVDAEGPRIEAALQRLHHLTEERDLLPRHIESLRKLLPLVPELTQLEGYETAALLIDARHASVVGSLNAELAAALEANFEMIADRVDADTIGAVCVFPRRHADTVRAILGREQVSRVRLPARYEGFSFRGAVSAMERRLTEIEPEVAGAEDELDALIRPRRDWATGREAVARRIEQLDVIRHLGATPHTFVLSGWVPDARLAEVRGSLGAVVGSVVVDEVVAGPAETPPVLMRNPTPVRPFELLVKLLALPRYGSLDPTGWMWLFLPLFFGMMLGDIAYGMVLLAIAVWVRRVSRKGSSVHDLSRILIMSSAWTVVWGVIYGELLGNLGHDRLGLRPLWINREEALEPLLILALAVGAAHVTLGLVLGLWEAARSRRRHVLAERGAMLLALIGLFLIAGAASGRLPSGTMTPAVAAVVVGLVGLMALGGAMGILMGPLELLGTIGNVLSYLRIAAIGLASVYLARVANELGAAGPLWFGVIIASLFHALNLALGAFSPAIQSLRLHYVEFFGKFYEEGGTAFAPFGAPAPSVEPAAPAARPPLHRHQPV